MEYFYEPYNALIGVNAFEYNSWVNLGAYTTGFIILLLSTMLLSVIFYRVYGNQSMKYATPKFWLRFGMFSSLVVILISAIVLTWMLPMEDFVNILFFGIINGLYSLILYVLITPLMQKFSKYASHVPRKIF